jgi:iron complex outermembrane receptor protein
MKTNRTNSLLFGASLLVLAACPVIASAAEAAADAPDVAKLEEVVVTGSRIVKEGYQSPTPLTVASMEAIQGTASSNVAQYLTTLPVFSGSLQASSGQLGTGNGQSGANSLNLRQLGYSRTLTLLDGQRVVPTQITGAVDISTFPQQLISRVEIVTGGASSVYGSDAVAGVVNFILDRKFTGFKGEISGGISSYGDDESGKIALSAGVPFADGRGHLLLSGEATADNGVMNGVGDRKWNRDGYQQIVNPAYTATNGQPLNLILNNVGLSTATFGGIVVSGPLRGTAFGQGGVPYQFQYGTITSDPFTVGGDWMSTEVQLTDLVSLAPRERRQNLFGRLSYDLTDNLTIFGQASWARSDIVAKPSNANMVGTAGPLLRADNAFIPASVRALLTPTSTLRIGTLNQDIGSAIAETDRRLNRYVVGADGHFEAGGKKWIWNAYYQRGISDNNSSVANNVIRAKYTQATDAVVSGGRIVCRSTLTNPNDGCVPYNPLGIGVNSPSAVNYITGVSSQVLKQTQSVVAASISGEPFDLWAGPVSVALSAEHRRDTINAVADPISSAAGFLAGNYFNVKGSSKVTEVAAETLIPLARDWAFAKSWDLSAAARLTDYSISGRVETWKVGTVYEPIDGLKFRLTRSRDIRAPTLNEFFAQGTTTTIQYFDPFTNAFVQSQFVSKGNLDLKPEKADATTVGVVAQPTFLPGFRASVDYWRVEVEDGIATQVGNDILNQCFLGDQAYCSKIIRTNGVVTFINGGSFNQASQTVRGVDIEATYSFALEDLFANVPGRLTLHTNMTRYLENQTNNGLTPATINNELGLRPVKFVTTSTVAYQLDTFRATLTARTSSAGKINANGIECTSACPTSTTANPTYNLNHINGYFYVDASVSYGFRLAGIADQVEVFANVRNLFNKDPAEVPIPAQPYVPRTNSTTIGGRFDTLGRLYRVGVRFKM